VELQPLLVHRGEDLLWGEDLLHRGEDHAWLHEQLDRVEKALWALEVPKYEAKVHDSPKVTI